MCRFRHIPIAFAVALVLSAATSSAATANWVISGTPLSGSAALATTSAVTENGKMTFSETTIECKGNNVSGVSPEIEAPNKASAASVIFSECSSTAGSNCKLAGTQIATLPVQGEVTAEGVSGARAVFSPKTKTTFATLKLEGEKCPLAGVEPVTGKATLTAPTMQESAETHESIANTASGELKVGTAAAVLKIKILKRLLLKLLWWWLTH